jgi:hypothetical protein
MIICRGLSIGRSITTAWRALTARAGTLRQHSNVSGQPAKHPVSRLNQTTSCWNTLTPLAQRGARRVEGDRSRFNGFSVRAILCDSISWVAAPFPYMLRETKSLITLVPLPGSGGIPEKIASQGT